MAKFIYRMQNILDIKYKLEETAKQEYTVARLALTEEEEKLEGLLARKNSYYEKYQEDFYVLLVCSIYINVSKYFF